jgi:hypothetical protein
MHVSHTDLTLCSSYILIWHLVRSNLFCFNFKTQAQSDIGVEGGIPNVELCLTDGSL